MLMENAWTCEQRKYEGNKTTLFVLTNKWDCIRDTQVAPLVLF